MACRICDRDKNYEEVESLIDEQLSLEKDIASKKIIKKRLEICDKCPFLEKHTCSKCGCFSRFRASLIKKECPINYW